MAERDDSKDADVLKDAQDRFATDEDALSEIKGDYESDYRFGRLSDQWPGDVQQQRVQDNRPCLTINRMPAFIRQVVNDGRQNRPAIKVRPVNTGASQASSEVMGGIIRHIEQISDADVAYDTALDSACSGGYGMAGVEVDYVDDDTFDMDLKIVSKPNPLAITWDSRSEAADSSDWEHAFETEKMSKEEFLEQYPDAKCDAADVADSSHAAAWYTDDDVFVRRFYLREQTVRKILLMSDGSILDAEKYTAPGDDGAPSLKELMDIMGVTVVRERSTRSHQVKIRLISGAEVLEEKLWRGGTIPLVPCYGETLNMEGQRYFRSLIYDAKDAQRIHNYSRSTATELVSLAPKVPFIGEEGTFDADPEKWLSINTKSWPYVEHSTGKEPPKRQPFTGVPEGAMGEAAAALEDMKSIIGIHDASLGIAGNEISGKAIRYRQHEGDVSTFHFVDNQHRMIRGLGRILLEMIPVVYTPGRIVRTIGQDGKPNQIMVGKPPMPGAPPAPNPMGM